MHQKGNSVFARLEKQFQKLQFVNTENNPDVQVFAQQFTT